MRWFGLGLTWLRGRSHLHAACCSLRCPVPWTGGRHNAYYIRAEDNRRKECFSIVPRATNRTAVTVAVIMATFLAALDITVVGTALPTIIGTMGGLDLYSWVFSAYLLTSTTTVPVYGRLADTYGRKPIFFVGAALFLGGSALCAAASNMEELILFRAIQGLGAGGVVPASVTVVGDIFSVEQRAKIQGMLSAVWAVSAIIGPAVGGLIVDRLDWRWVFYVNIPFGILSILLFAFLHETVAHHRRRVDYTGAAGLTVAISLLLLGLLESDQSNSSLPVPSWGLLAVAAALLCLFVWRESTIDEPLLPVSLFKNRVLSISYAASFLVGATLMGYNSFVPPFVQGVLGGTAINAGAVLAPMSIGWPIGSTLSGRLVLRFGYRPIVLVGTGLILAGSLLLLPLGPASPQLFIMGIMVVTGLGMGFCATSFLVAVQSAVGWGQRGIATASIQFFRSMGGAVGVALMGALMNGGLSEGLRSMDRVPPGSAGVGISAASVILDPGSRLSLPIETLEALRELFSSSLHSVYVAIAMAALLGVAVTILFPGGSVAEHAHNEPVPARGTGSDGEAN